MYAEVVYNLSHKKLLDLASDAGAIYRMDSTVLINKDIFDQYLERLHEPATKEKSLDTSDGKSGAKKIKRKLQIGREQTMEGNIWMFLQNISGFYFLKEELVKFCRENGLSVSGGKIDITDRSIFTFNVAFQK